MKVENVVPFLRRPSGRVHMLPALWSGLFGRHRCQDALTTGLKVNLPPPVVGTSGSIATTSQCSSHASSLGSSLYEAVLDWLLTFQLVKSSDSAPTAHPQVEDNPFDLIPGQLREFPACVDSFRESSPEDSTASEPTVPS